MQLHCGLGCAGTPGCGGLRTATAGIDAGLGSAGSGSESKSMVAATAGRPALSPFVGAQTAGTWVETQKVGLQSMGTQTEAQDHVRSVEMQTEPPTVETQEVQTDIVSSSVWWQLLEIIELHFLQYVANQQHKLANHKLWLNWAENTSLVFQEYNIA